jgi:hypothetical protein
MVTSGTEHKVFTCLGKTTSPGRDGFNFVLCLQILTCFSLEWRESGHG